MKKIILLFFTLFILVGCTTSSLQLNKEKELVLNYSDANIVLTNKIVESDSTNFKDLLVTIYKLQNNANRVLFYENAETGLDYEFNFGGLYSVMYVFDNIKKYTQVYRHNNLRLVQLNLKDGKYLNVLIQASDIQNYSFVYGFSNEEFMNLAQSIKGKEENKIGRLEYEGIVFNKKSKPLSNWNDKIVFFAPLITPLRIFGGR